MDRFSFKKTVRYDQNRLSSKRKLREISGFCGRKSKDRYPLIIASRAVLNKRAERILPPLALHTLWGKRQRRWRDEFRESALPLFAFYLFVVIMPFSLKSQTPVCYNDVRRIRCYERGIK